MLFFELLRFFFFYLGIVVALLHLLLLFLTCRYSCIFKSLFDHLLNLLFFHLLTCQQRFSFSSLPCGYICYKPSEDEIKAALSCANSPSKYISHVLSNIRCIIQRYLPIFICIFSFVDGITFRTLPSSFNGNLLKMLPAYV